MVDASTSKNREILMGRTLFSTPFHTRNNAKSEPVFTIGGNLDNLYGNGLKIRLLKAKYLYFIHYSNLWSFDMIHSHPNLQ